MNAALLLLADGRLPTGAHAHSGGTESAVAIGDVTDVGSLEAFVRHRLATAGVVDAAFAAAACAGAPLGELTDEYWARTGSPKLRAVSATLGRQLLRTGRRAWPHPCLEATDVPQPVAMGLVAHAAGCTPQEAAAAELHHLIGSLTTAAVRLLGLDPFDVAALSARLAPTVGTLAASSIVTTDPADLPADVDLLVDVLAEDHTTWEVRLFAS